MGAQIRKRLSSAAPRDGNSYPHLYDAWGFIEKVAPTAFVAGTNTRGDHDGTNAAYKLFNVTGDVIIRLFGVCTVDLAGATATLSVGTTLSTANIIALTTGTDLDVGDLWHDATPDNNVEATSVAAERLLVNGADIYETVATASLTAGNIYYMCGWYPLSYDGAVEAAV